MTTVFVVDVLSVTGTPAGTVLSTVGSVVTGSSDGGARCGESDGGARCGESDGGARCGESDGFDSEVR